MVTASGLSGVAFLAMGFGLDKAFPDVSPHISLGLVVGGLLLGLASSIMHVLERRRTRPAAALSMSFVPERVDGKTLHHHFDVTNIGEVDLYLHGANLEYGDVKQFSERVANGPIRKGETLSLLATPAAEVMATRMVIFTIFYSPDDDRSDPKGWCYKFIIPEEPAMQPIKPMAQWAIEGPPTLEERREALSESLEIPVGSASFMLEPAKDGDWRPVRWEVSDKAFQYDPEFGNAQLAIRFGDAEHRYSVDLPDVDSHFFIMTWNIEKRMASMEVNGIEALCVEIDYLVATSDRFRFH